MIKKQITGIQQVGIGVTNVKEAFTWYRMHFGMDIKVFEEAAVAQLMLPYTEGKPRERHAILAMNMQGGGGFEIWQHTGKTPQQIKFKPQLGDLGIFVAKMKTYNAGKAFSNFKENGVKLLSEIENDPSGRKYFWVEDPYGNIFQFVQEQDVYMDTDAMNGGVYGAIIGVKNIDQSLVVYKDILDYDTVVYDKTEIFPDFKTVDGGSNTLRRVLLKHSEPRRGGFSPLFGATEIELVQAVEHPAKSLFEGRIWGDPGFIHLCFDTIGIDALRQETTSKGFPFTVDSAQSFDMGEAAGHFVYISDPDGTPIEFVETHKIPILKKIGWNLNLKGRDPNKSIPRWMINTMKWKRVKD